MEAKRVIGIGEMVLDIVFMDGQPKVAVPGGSSFNALVSLGRSLEGKCPVEMVSQTGDDQVSGMMLDFMQRNYVGSSYLSKESGRQSTLSMAMLNSRGDASYEFFRDADMPGFSAPEIEFSEHDIVLFGSFFALGESTREAARQLVIKAREKGAQVYYDINFRKSHMADLERMRSEIEHNCRLATVVRGSSEDIELVFGFTDGRTAYEEKMKGLCPNFIYTRADKPAELFWGSASSHSKHPVAPIEVLSTIGAGDSFNAGFIYGLLHDCTPQSCMDYGLRFSAAVCASMENYVPSGFSEKLLGID